eukprot:4552928-Pleurochrysis_carterae.AAC.1
MACRTCRALGQQKIRVRGKKVGGGILCSGAQGGYEVEKEGGLVEGVDDRDRSGRRVNLDNGR